MAEEKESRKEEKKTKEPRHPMLNPRQKELKLQSPLSQLKDPATAKVV